MGFNIAKLSLKDTFELKLRNPATDEVIKDEDTGEDITITLYGTSSKQYRNAVNSLHNSRLKKKNGEISAEKLREDSIELLVACSDKASGLEYEDFTFDLPDNSAGFRKLYSAPELSWVKDQVDAALGEVGNFLTQ